MVAVFVVDISAVVVAIDDDDDNDDDVVNVNENSATKLSVVS